VGIDKIKLGPRSRLLEKKELDAMVDDMVALHPPLPGPVNPSNVRGCGCGQFHVPAGAEAGVEIDGAVHRYAKPCYREEAGERVYYNAPGKRPSIEERVKALEVLVVELQRRIP